MNETIYTVASSSGLLTVYLLFGIFVVGFCAYLMFKLSPVAKNAISCVKNAINRRKNKKRDNETEAAEENSGKGTGAERISVIVATVIYAVIICVAVAMSVQIVQTAVKLAAPVALDCLTESGKYERLEYEATYYRGEVSGYECSFYINDEKYMINEFPLLSKSELEALTAAESVEITVFYKNLSNREGRRVYRIDAEKAAD